uniref:Uncharacterized protein n=1 Tax=Timema tahoe TaxID=61484 RepID=A0A7R9NXB3_9NEOP|nr:unnamed protein product [Timema tahoe]
MTGKEQRVHRTIQGSGKENASVFACCSAAGRVPPPLIIFESAHLWSSWKGENDIPALVEEQPSSHLRQWNPHKGPQLLLRTLQFLVPHPGMMKLAIPNFLSGAMNPGFSSGTINPAIDNEFTVAIENLEKKKKPGKKVPEEGKPRLKNKTSKPKLIDLESSSEEEKEWVESGDSLSDIDVFRNDQEDIFVEYEIPLEISMGNYGLVAFIAMPKRKLEEELEIDWSASDKKLKAEAELKKNSLDSDEEDDAVGTAYDVLADDDIEGQEDGVAGFDGETQITPFNMKEELEEGHFDTDGNYHWAKDKRELRDNWLENIDWIKPVKVTEADSDSTGSEGTPFDPVPAYRQMLELMKPGETVAKAIRRLGISSLLCTICYTESRSIPDHLYCLQCTKYSALG